MQKTKSRRDMSAVEALGLAQQIAFSPIVFQAVRTLWKRGILDAVHHGGEEGVVLVDIVAAAGLSTYATKVLLDMGIGAGVLAQDGAMISLTTLGWSFLHDPMTQANMNFVHDTCYEAAYFLEESVITGRPEGLRVFGEYSTLYEGLAELPEHARAGWFAFDHYYSDMSFDAALKYVFATPTRHILDIGGNTGRWASRCLQHDPDVRVTIIDLPGQLDMARERLSRSGYLDRVNFQEADLLDADSALATTADTIWMGQFLDCFAEDEIVSILERASQALDPGGRIVIMEPFVDRQQFEAAAYSLKATSLYFTFLANGNSRIYTSTDFLRCVKRAGLTVSKSIDRIGVCNTILECVPA